MPIAAQASTNSYKFVLAAESGDRDSVNGKAVQSWASMIEEKSKGRMKVSVFFQGELGGQQEMFDQLVKGNIHMMLTWPQTSYDKRIVVNYIPYLVLNWEDAIKSYGQDGWVRKLMYPVYKDMGLKYFGPFPEGFGGIGTKGRYATSFEKAKGIKVRSQPIFPLPQTVQAMGFEAVPIDWAEVYTSIQTGVVDGDSTNVIFWDYQYFRDQLNYFVQSSHNFASYSLLMNGETWEKLDEEDRTIVASAARAVIEAQFANAKAEDEKWVAAAQKAGLRAELHAHPDDARPVQWRVHEQAGRRQQLRHVWRPVRVGSGLQRGRVRARLPGADAEPLQQHHVRRLPERRAALRQLHDDVHRRQGLRRRHVPVLGRDAGPLQRDVHRQRHRSDELRHVRDAVRRRHGVQWRPVRPQLPGGDAGPLQRRVHEQARRHRQLRPVRHHLQPGRVLHRWHVRVPGGRARRGERRLHEPRREQRELRHVRTGLSQRHDVHGWRVLRRRRDRVRHHVQGPPERYGGEEFAVILPGTDIDGALAVAERMRRSACDLRIPHERGIDGLVSCSFGVASLTPGGADTPLKLLQTADSGLYAAKREGRNRVLRASA